MKQINFLVLILFLLSACSAEGNVAPSTLLSSEEGKYVVLMLFEENAAQEQVNEVTAAVLESAEGNDILQETIISMEPEKYGFEAEQLPVILIMDTREIVLETSHPGTAMEFLQENL